MVKRSALKTVGAVCLCAAMAPLSTSAFAVGDVLETPAMETQLAAQSLLLDIARAGERLVAVGERGHIIYSDDAGDNWVQAQVPVQVTLTSVTFPSENMGWAVGHSGAILHSADAGQTWDLQFDGFEGSELTIEFLEETLADLEARIEETEDEDERADLEWKLEELEFTLDDAMHDAEAGPWQPLLDVWFENNDHGIAVGSYGQIFRTKDGGETWENRAGSMQNPDRFHLNGIAEVHGGTLFIAAESGLVFRSTNKGESWEVVETPYHGSYFGVVGTGRTNEVLAFGLRGNIFRSENLGRDWEQIQTDANRTINSGHTAGGGEVALVANDGVVLTSSDGGKSFRTHTRASRHSYVGVLVLSDAGLVLVGERGALRTDARGRDFLL